MEFTSVTPVILGALSLGARSGYDVKALVDISTRFFWAASYGQIYPELKRLEAAGLIAGESAPSGERKRTAYHLTPAGRQALVDWLGSPDLTYELRDEGLLKLFFAGALAPSEGVAILGAMRERHLKIVAELEAIEPRARQKGGFPYVVLQAGMELHGRTATVCEELEQRLLAELEQEEK